MTKIQKVSLVVGELSLASAGTGLALWRMRQWWKVLNSAEYAPALHHGGLWPTPGIYLVEVCVLAVAALVAISLSHFSERLWLRLLWGLIGAFATLAILGAWSIGPSIAPVIALIAAAGLLAKMRARLPGIPLFQSLLVGAAGQLAFMIFP